MNTTTEPKKAALVLKPAPRTKGIDLHQRPDVTALRGAAALISLQPELGRHYSARFLHGQFRSLAAQVAALFIESPELRGLYHTDDFVRVVRQLADRLLSAARVRESERGF